MMRIAFLIPVIVACSEKTILLEPEERLILEEMRWSAYAVPTDSTNGVFEDSEAQAFGKDLFYDPRLSANGVLSCGSCHQAERGFADGLVLAEGIGVAARHTATLLGASHQEWFFWDGGCDSQWCQAVSPMENPSEMDFTRAELAHLIHRDEGYRAQYEALFEEMPALEELERFPEVARPNWSDEESSEHVAWMSMSSTDQEAVNRVLTNATKSMAAFRAC